MGFISGALKNLAIEEDEPVLQNAGQTNSNPHQVAIAEKDSCGNGRDQ